MTINTKTKTATIIIIVFVAVMLFAATWAIYLNGNQKAPSPSSKVANGVAGVNGSTITVPDSPYNFVYFVFTDADNNNTPITDGYGRVDATSYDFKLYNGTDETGTSTLLLTNGTYTVLVADDVDGFVGQSITFTVDGDTTVPVALARPLPTPEPSQDRTISALTPTGADTAAPPEPHNVYFTFTVNGIAPTDGYGRIDATAYDFKLYNGTDATGTTALLLMPGSYTVTAIYYVDGVTKLEQPITFDVGDSDMTVPVAF